MLHAALLLAQLAAPTGVASPAAADARCIVVFGFIGSRSAPEQAQTTTRGILYFLGKLRGRAPNVDVAATVEAASKAAGAAGLNARAEAARCGAEVEAAGAALRAVRATTPGR